MSERPAPFGVELRRRRVAAGWSLRQLAERIHYSKSYLSKVENGSKPPAVDLARRCDAALNAGGRLAELARPREVAPSARDDLAEFDDALHPEADGAATDVEGM